MSSTKELLMTLNALRVKNGKTELSAWKSGREKLEKAIAELQPSEETKNWITDDEPVDVTDPSMPMGEDGNTLVDPAEETSEEPSLEETSDEQVEPVVVEKAPRGAIGALVMELLVTDMPYVDIVAQVKSTYPSAKTTARSIASVAMDLREAGIAVPSRRKPAAIKALKASA